MHVHVVRTSSCTLLLSVARFTLHADCDLAAVVESCPLNMTGADFYALCSDAMLNALKTQVKLLQQGAYQVHFVHYMCTIRINDAQSIQFSIKLLHRYRG